jgi:hydroxymethylpyrimidine pyrophosphatase-like HAD family hydrolase
MLVFDLDGVVTDPDSLTYDVNKDIIEIIAQDLRRHIPVALNTGRAVSWVEAQVLPHLKEVDADALSLLTIVGEKGGAVAEFDGNVWQSNVDEELALPTGFKAKALEILDRDRAGHKLSKYMFWDEDKLTMGSFEKYPSIPIEEFSNHQAVLTTDLDVLMRHFNMSDFKLDIGLLATDVEHISAGKHKGAQQIVSWLTRHRIMPKSYITFGDSSTDALMAAVFSTDGTPTTFVYVGDVSKYKPPRDAKFQTTILNGNYARDTLMYLKSMRSS